MPKSPPAPLLLLFAVSSLVLVRRYCFNKKEAKTPSETEADQAYMLDKREARFFNALDKPKTLGVTLIVGFLGR